MVLVVATVVGGAIAAIAFVLSSGTVAVVLLGIVALMALAVAISIRGRSR